jgi:Mn-dependent DtxR family transcriptional regulator
MNSKGKENSMTLELLEAIEEKSDVTQRRLARELGVALGLANSYLKRCERKGLVKIHKAPANRYLYYLTPKGFAENLLRRGVRTLQARGLVANHFVWSIRARRDRVAARPGAQSADRMGLRRRVLR